MLKPKLEKTAVLFDYKQTYGCPGEERDNSQESGGVQNTPGNRKTHSVSVSSTSSQELHQAKTSVCRAVLLATIDPMEGESLCPQWSLDLDGETLEYSHT